MHVDKIIACNRSPSLSKLFYSSSSSSSSCCSIAVVSKCFQERPKFIFSGESALLRNLSQNGTRLYSSKLFTFYDLIEPRSITSGDAKTTSSFSYGFGVSLYSRGLSDGTLPLQSSKINRNVASFQNSCDIQYERDSESQLENASDPVIRTGVMELTSITKTLSVYALKVRAEDCNFLVKLLRNFVLKRPYVKSVYILNHSTNTTQTNKGINHNHDGIGVENKLRHVNESAGGDTADVLNKRMRLEINEIVNHKTLFLENSAEVENSVNGFWAEDENVRLILLDEKLTDCSLHEFPSQLKTVLGFPPNERTDALNKEFKLQLFLCKLYLPFNYLTLNEIFSEILPADTDYISSFSIIGHIAHLNLKFKHLKYRYLIADAILKKYYPKIKTVINKTENINSKFRTFEHEFLAGEKNLFANVAENGCNFFVDFSSVFWNPRLSTERKRLIRKFSPSDVVCDMFAGVGPFSIMCAKKVKFVFANDLNSEAAKLISENAKINHVDKKIEVYNLDGREFIMRIFEKNPFLNFTQVIMNLPSDALSYMNVFKHAYAEKNIGKVNFTLPTIHLYGFSKHEDPKLDFSQRIENFMGVKIKFIEVHKVRLVAPGKFMLCASFVLPRDYALPA